MTVCVVRSLFFQVTVVPTGTVNVEGMNELFCIEIAVPPVGVTLPVAVAVGVRVGPPGVGVA